MSEPIRLTSTVDGEPFLSTDALSLLLGVDEGLIAERFKQTDPSTSAGVMLLPEAWMKQGRRRAREAMAHTGSNDMLSALRYWARKKGLDVILTEDPEGGDAHQV
ncbi:hypothetical protein [Williamsia sp. 1135]|uniref:hypothetical protein n=1 Tax=Williamsia sp. 1135 TaxID=1889262 RepID=UPI000A0F7709|nr:hypothetical protein [Williamsia sp. 1135]ORM29237.1 hypothetical protein BFL43_20425 [Williamsia sp. 1135]